MNDDQDKNWPRRSIQKTLTFRIGFLKLSKLIIKIRLGVWFENDGIKNKLIIFTPFDPKAEFLPELYLDLPLDETGYQELSDFLINNGWGEIYHKLLLEIETCEFNLDVFHLQEQYELVRRENVGRI